MCHALWALMGRPAGRATGSLIGTPLRPFSLSPTSTSITSPSLQMQFVSHDSAARGGAGLLFPCAALHCTGWGTRVLCTVLERAARLVPLLLCYHGQPFLLLHCFHMVWWAWGCAIAPCLLHPVHYLCHPPSKQNISSLWRVDASFFSTAAIALTSVESPMGSQDRGVAAPCVSILVETSLQEP